MTFSTKILILNVVLMILSCAGGAYAYMQLRLHAQVIDTQGQVIKLMFETPAINAAVTQELKRRQGVLPDAKATSTNP